MRVDVTRGSPSLWSAAQEGNRLAGTSLTQMLQPTSGFHLLLCYLCSPWPGAFPCALIFLSNLDISVHQSKKAI